MDRVKAKRWLPAFKYFCSLVSVVSKELEEPGPIQLYTAQRLALETIEDGLAQGIHHFVWLKARQLGVSTILLLLDMFWLYMHPGLQGAFVCDTADNREIFRETIKQMMDSLPGGFKIPVEKHDRTMLVLANGSRLQYLSAGTGKNSGLGRSRGLNYLHACVPAGTPVVIGDGHIKLIEEISAGDTVLTHSGAVTTVLESVNKPNDKGALIKITPWLGQALEFTAEHKIATAKGLVKAKDIAMADQLVMPIRAISKETSRIRLPETPHRVQNGGAIGFGSGAEIELTEEFGFACGYYLAEGHIARQSVGGSGKSADRYSAIIFSRHRDEGAYSDRATAALASVARAGKTYDSANSLTTMVTVYGASLAMWMNEHFGRVDSKRIPDEVFTWGEDFCRGLLSGLLCGDGSKTVTYSKNYAGRGRNAEPTISRNGKVMGRPQGSGTTPDRKLYPISRVMLPSTRASLVLQARDLAASLGYGWAALAHKSGGLRHGRNCKERWTATWCGGAAAKLRLLMGLPPVATGKSTVEKYKIDGERVLIRIRKIEIGSHPPDVWDICVAHADHTFRTPFMSISNSELGRWGDPKGYETLMDTLALENPNRLYLFESTALGFNLFYDCWRDAVDSPESRRAAFLGWWAKEPYSFEEGSADFKRWWGAYPAYTDYEARVTQEVFNEHGIEITPRQWAWYRSKADGRAEQSVFEEFPGLASEAFQSTGHPFFSHQRITADINFIRDNTIAYQGYRYELGENFLKMKMRLATEVEEVQLRVWEKPQPNARYVIGIDPAYGSSEEADSTVISVWRCFSDKLVQVAEYASPLTTTQNCAWVLAHLAGEYRDCIMNLEINGGGGEVAMEIKHLRQSIQFGGLMSTAREMKLEHVLDSARWFLWRKPDSIGGIPTANHFKTSGENKALALNRFNDAYIGSQLIVRSIPLLEEMTTMKREGDRISASGRNKDDRVMAGMLACYAWKEWIQTGMMALNRSFDREMREQLDRQVAGTDIMAQIVPQFLAERAAERTGIDLKRLLEGPLQ